MKIHTQERGPLTAAKFRRNYQRAFEEPLVNSIGDAHEAFALDAVFTLPKTKVHKGHGYLRFSHFIIKK